MKAHSHEPLASNDEILARVTDLVGTASRRQLWLMFLDEHDVQLPLLMPADVPARPGRRDLRPFSTFLEEVVKATDCWSIVVTLERPGPGAPTDDDSAWFRLVADAGCLAGIRLRGPILSSSDGVRFLDPAELS
jgi:hypothetical protein